ncbi:bifunctional 3,4-dihydroxy-2-butanone-4-phosphate synthase/GTP cyclohydrolase II, partial [candidate division KSB1 bacterium]|nr:bifunctional 3,4-dihydroxy-2-butanone-4-phosphate synthase/GTP cyclohydrolase II [candidate division KSB1 bacterium]
MNKHHTETKLQTKYGDFIFRVYADTQGKETVVLYKEDLDPENPVLVRVHSECLTGDLFGSLRCDCGEQFETSMKMINADDNGVMIYLR